MKYAIDIEASLMKFLDGKAVVLTIDRDYWLLMKFLRNSYERGSVLIMPYVSSTFLDIDQDPPLRHQDKDPDSWYFFRGTMKRKHGGLARPMMYEMAKEMKGADFKGVVLNKKDHSIFGILNSTSTLMRRSSVCLCPEGDSPTSLRVFEALASGCVPLIMVDRIHMATNLPFPSQINWDRIALFTHPLGYIKNITHMVRAIESVAGRDAGQEQLDKLDAMRREGRRVFNRYFSYLRNAEGVAEAMLFEAWVQIQRKGAVEGPYFNAKAAEKAKTDPFLLGKTNPRYGGKRYPGSTRKDPFGKKAKQNGIVT
eukprot:CAMPEP_0173452052 /NCGR_PEP_ID=MMETSP1357-20121228/47959_1 /TAXON_ID=77926 /ORGANISM="Hemiselmis rufescens, Strain PCC563" /LENGTH=310 /DNA_ID=CAMNT_0014418877 /DNA_START=25 /DNA_END=957 /DNA_ORIENTATION=-